MTLYRRGGVSPPAKRSHRLLAVARIHLPCKAKEALKEVKSGCQNGTILTVGTDVLDCVRDLLFSGEEKRSKKVAGTLATVSRTKAPGRNYKLLPALAIDSPLGCQCGYAAASRPQRF